MTNINNNNNNNTDILNNVVKSVSDYDTNGKSRIRNMRGVSSLMKFSDFNYLLSSKQSLTDIDGQFEYNRNLFIIESKTHFNSINGGQLLSVLNTALNTYKTGKLAQVVLRIELRDDKGAVIKDEEGNDIYTFVVFASEQLEQLANNKPIKPYYAHYKTNHWLAVRLKNFEKECDKRFDYETKKNNGRVFALPSILKKEIQQAQYEARKKFKEDKIEIIKDTLPKEEIKDIKEDVSLDILDEVSEKPFLIENDDINNIFN